MNVGEIFWVEFPTRGGRAQAGRRPATITQKGITKEFRALVPELTARRTGR
jgi:hypothetical protein